MGNVYNSMSRHAFAIGQHTGLIIDYAVYSTAYKQYEMENREETTVVDDDTFWQSTNTQIDNSIIKRTLVDPLELNQLVNPK